MASAEPLNTQSECNTTGNVPSGWNVELNNGKALNYYVKSDYASTLTECTPDTDDDSIVGQVHVNYNVQRAAETWNLQTRSIPLVYRGTTSHTDPEDFCNDPFIEKPAVYVDFRKGCKCTNADPQTCTDADCKSSKGSIHKIKDCSDAVRITTWGDKTTYGACSTEARDWRTDSVTSWGEALVRNVTHELGHALNVGHSGSGVDAIMRGSSAGRHTFAYDRDCVNDSHVSGGRDVNYHYKSYASSSWSSIDSHFMDTDRGNWSGHYWRSGSSNLTYAVYTNPYIDWGYPSSSHFGGFVDDWDNIPSVLQNYVDTIPVFHSRTSPETGDYHSIISVFSGWSATNAYPPYLRRQASDDWFDTSSGSTMWHCLDSGCSGSNMAQIRSSFPVSTTWDPYTWQDVFVRVRDMDQLGGGTMVIHGGLESSSSTKISYSPAGALGSGNTSFPGFSHTYWEYEGLTDVLPGVACAPNRNTFAYNCLLAWVDRGAPTGRVLYTYFRINGSTNAIEWLGNAYARGGSATVGPVAATYAHGRFWMAWKSWDAPHRLTTTYTSSSYTGWSSVDQTNRADMVGPPSFQSWPTGSTAMNLFWTELP